MEALEVDGVRASWDASRRHATFEYSRDFAPTALGGERLRDALDAWVGPSEPYAMIVDATGLARVSLLWRLDWTSHMRRHRGRVRISAYNIPWEIEPLIFAFIWGTGLEVRTFPDRERAAAWVERSSADDHDAADGGSASTPPA